MGLTLNIGLSVKNQCSFLPIGLKTKDALRIVGIALGIISILAASRQVGALNLLGKINPLPEILAGSAIIVASIASRVFTISKKTPLPPPALPESSDDPYSLPEASFTPLPSVQGEKQLPNLREYTPNLYGSARPGYTAFFKLSETIAKNLNALKAQHFTHIISLSDREHEVSDDLVIRERWQSLGGEFEHIRVEDHLNIPFQERTAWVKTGEGISLKKLLHFNQLIDRIKKSNPGAKIMVYCGAGIGRTAPMLGGYRLAQERCSAIDALRHLRINYRPAVIAELPHNGGFDALKQLEEHLKYA